MGDAYKIPLMSSINLLSQAKILVGLVIGYTLIYFANNYLTSALYLVPGAHLIHIPSGIKILMVLVTGWVGALAIFCSALLWGLLVAFPEQYALVFLLSLGGAVLPYLVCQYFIQRFSLDDDLSNLTANAVFYIAIAYSIANSITIQSILYLHSPENNWANGIVVMFLGDVSGILIVISFAYWLKKLFTQN